MLIIIIIIIKEITEQIGRQWDIIVTKMGINRTQFSIMGTLWSMMGHARKPQDTACELMVWYRLKKNGINRTRWRNMGHDGT